MKLCAILTCFNRREKTLRCIRSVQALWPDIEIYLVDDGSTDGTGDAARAAIRYGEVIAGDGNLFWCRGMAKAWTVAASRADYDYTLWLNDDVELLPNALTELLECAAATQGRAVISGLIGERQTHQVLYGGCGDDGRLLSPSGQLQAVVSMNGNCVLVPRAVFQKVGGLDATFHHDLGDVDYGLRSRRAGFGVFTTRQIVAWGERNDYCRVRKPGVGLISRFKRLYSPLGSPPHLNFVYRRRHKGWANAIAYYVHLHLLNLLSDSACHRLFGDRYR